MVLANLSRGVAIGLEQFGDRRILVLKALLGRRHANFEQPGAERRLAQDKRSPARRAGLLSVVVSEQRAFLGDAVDVGCAPAHHSPMVSADVPDADVVGHDHDDIRLFGCSLSLSGSNTAASKRAREYRSR